MSVAGQIGQYQVLEELGAGGMGVVYRALDTEVQREVALKRLRSEFAASPAVLERFRNEARLQGRLSHPNIAQLYSLLQTSDAFCIVMELVTGVVVRELMPLPWPAAAAVVLQVLDALGYAHSLSVLHRDIKPENIILDVRGTVKVMDFGIAYAVGSERMTREKSLIGTIEYMSPERILGKPMDGRSDIYAVGILLFELLSGRLPFETPNEYDLLKLQVEASAPSILTVADVPPPFDAVIQRAMAKAPEDRFATCEEMASELKARLPGPPCSADELRTLVAARVRRSEPFDQQACWLRARDLIESGDIVGARKFLVEQSGRHPGEARLRQYGALVSDVAEQLRQSPSEGNEIAALLRLAAQRRVQDTAAYEHEFSRFCAEHPHSHLAELLAADPARSAGSRREA